ncbi:MAG: sugar phosphate isomerase/epimerase [Candidatus Latescibacteria bacterium]|nr:sugar phosphate isomerase/epimerase [Candidatus Latescibacterota bacterium]
MTRFSYIMIDQLPVRETELSELFTYVKECGYEGVELNLTPDVLANLDNIDVAARAVGLVIPSFLTGAAYSDGLCLSSPDPDIRRRTVELLAGYVKIARRFDAILVFGLLQGLLSDESHVALANERIVSGLRQVGGVAHDNGVDIVVEPVNHLQVGFNNSVAEVRELIDNIGSPALRPMVDTIHMNIEDRSVTQPILDCGSTLRHVHLCESNGAMLGSGHIDFGSVLNALDQVGYEDFASVKIYRKVDLRDGIKGGLAHLKDCR